MASDGVFGGRKSGINGKGSEQGSDSQGFKSSASGSGKPKESAKMGSPWSRPPLGSYGWDAPSPSPAEVEELIRLFPEVIQVPITSLECEAGAWGEKAVLARSLTRWVPPEAIVRELHRAGLPGDIEVVPLAHRHFLIRLSDPQSKSRILERPWVINGQVLAVADWMPEFFPAEGSLLHALVWVRLPLLPMEFWADEILSSILSVAGEFLFSDEPTKARKRGGYARACVRVNLGLPLRPGARIRGIGVPFWQQFSFENLEGICVRCASLHLTGPCKLAGESSTSSSVPSFGPWLAAVRRRRPPVAQQPVQKEGIRSSQATFSVSKDGWTVPKKFARRQVPPSDGSLMPFSGKGSGLGVSAGDEPLAMVTGEPGLKSLSASPSLVSVPISLVQADPRLCSSVPVGTVAQFQNSDGSGPQSEILKVQSMMSECDKAINLPKLDLVVCTSKGPVSGLSKRARPVEPSTTRMPSRFSKAKGKASLSGGGGDKVAFKFEASSVSGRESPTQLGPGAKKARGRAGASSGSVSECCSHISAVHRLKQAILAPDSAVPMDSVQILDCDDPGPLTCPEVAPGEIEVLKVSNQAVICTSPGDLDCSVKMSGGMGGELPNPALP